MELLNEVINESQLKESLEKLNEGSNPSKDKIMNYGDITNTLKKVSTTMQQKWFIDLCKEGDAIEGTNITPTLKPLSQALQSTLGELKKIKKTTGIKL